MVNVDDRVQDSNVKQVHAAMWIDKMDLPSLFLMITHDHMLWLAEMCADGGKMWELMSGLEPPVGLRITNGDNADDGTVCEDDN
jgi:hypothetical protein